eukprot:11423053-Alexandrium_andersonii.AAC.1
MILERGGPEEGARRASGSEHGRHGGMPRSPVLFPRHAAQRRAHRGSHACERGEEEPVPREGGPA